MDFIWAIIFLAWYEALSLPLRWALASWSAPADVRRMLSRVAGPPLLALPIWVAAHFGGHFLDRPVGLAWLALAGVIGLWAGLRRTRNAARLMAYEPDARGRRAPELALDAVMVALLLAFVAFRRWVPEMTTYQLDSSAAEKFANAMIHWSTWNARQLPPEDHWFAGTPLNYYYWGHFQWAWLARMGGFPVALALNLAFATAVTLTWSAAYLLARAARLPRAWAAGAGICVAWAGNPQAVTQLKMLLPSWRAQGAFPWAAYDFWGPSRAIPNVVDEFPAFSAILGDFHSHHLALPWLTGWMALGVAGRRWPGSGALNTALWGSVWIALGAAAALTNLWNMPLLALGAAVILLASLRRGRRVFFTRFALALALGAVLLLGMRLLRGDAPLPLPAGAAPTLWARLMRYKLDPALRSPLANLYGLWGFPVAALLLAAAARLLPERAPKNETASPTKASGSRKRASQATAPRQRTMGGVALLHGATLLLLLGGGALVLLQLTPFGAHLPFGVAWAWVGVMLWIAALMLGRRPWLSPGAGAALLTGCAVLAGLEVAYLPDRFVGEYARYNSYFKFSYPIWPVLWVGAWAAARRLWRARLHWSLVCAVRLALALLLIPCAVYTVCAAPARILMARSGDDPANPRQLTLDAYAFVAHRPLSAPEAPLLEWIRRNVPAGERIAEGAFAVPAPDAPAYKYQGRIASLTGHPVPIGWEHHEQQWRGEGAFAQLDERVAAVNALYNAPTPQELQRRAAELGVRWIVYGVHEAQLYGKSSLDKLLAWLPVAEFFPDVAPKVYIFKINPETKTN